MKGPLRDSVIEFSSADFITSESLEKLYDIGAPLAEFLEGHRQWTAQALFDAEKDKKSSEEITRLKTALQECDQLIIRAYKARQEIERELDLGASSTLKLDKKKTKSTGKRHIKLHSLEQWIEDNRPPTATNLEDELSPTLSNNIHTTLAFLVEIHSQTASKYHHADDRPNIDTIANQIAKVAKEANGNQPLGGQSAAKVSILLKEALRIKASKLPSNKNKK
jgi:hypothetical protein